MLAVHLVVEVDDPGCCCSVRELLLTIGYRFSGVCSLCFCYHLVLHGFWITGYYCYSLNKLDSACSQLFILLAIDQNIDSSIEYQSQETRHQT